jgi:hypothetical protein
MPCPDSESRPTLFATTRWTLVVEAASGNDTVATEALGALFQTYWQPLYRYARRKGKPREDARAEGSAAQFGRLKGCLTSDSQRIPYTDLAAELDMTEGALRVAVHRLRKRYRDALTAEITRTLASPDAVGEEMEALFAALAR